MVKHEKWFITPPKYSKPQKKQKGGKDWWWCPNHTNKGKWVCHDPATCEQPKRSEPAPPASIEKEEEVAEKSLQVKTLAALLDLNADKDSFDF
jgi:hypothetical protein